MPSIAHAISAALLHFIWEGLVVAFMLWLTLAMLRRSSATLRYVFSCAALAIMIALPFITAWIVYRAPGEATTSSYHAIAIPDAAGPATFSAVSLLSQWIAVFEAWALPVWSAGVMIFAVRLFWSCQHVARLRRESDPAGTSLAGTVSHLTRRMNITRPLRVVLSRLIDAPSVVGWLRPVILIPFASLMNLSPSQLEAVLAHELAHVQRNDYLVNLLQSVAEMLLFYQPAIWWVSSLIRKERELCCDEAAVGICGDPLVYARALTQLERLRVIKPELAVGSTSGSLMYRIQRLTGVAEERSASTLPVVLALCLAIICFTTNLHWADAQAQVQSGGEKEISRDAIWVDTVKYGDLPITVRAPGTVTSSSIVELSIDSGRGDSLQIGQPASIELRQGLTAAGTVTRVDSPVNGTVPVTVQLKASAAEFVNQPVDCVVQIRTLNSVVYLGRPAIFEAKSEGTVFKLGSDGIHATRVKVRFGTLSVNSVQIIEGLKPGDKVIISDTAEFDRYDRIKLK
jgi:beta-lactamase regulating signal transducer with metallopeptidase domain